jgi:4-carboxymuconolactone decarboxylase
MADVDVEILRRYNQLSGYVIFGPEPRALDLKTRFLVLVGITTAVKGDREGIEWSTRRAMEHGATEAEVLEAIVLAGLPAGSPAVEFAARVWQEAREGRGWVE